MAFSFWHGLHIFGMVVLLCGICGIVLRGQSRNFLALTYLGLMLILFSGGFNSVSISPDLKFPPWIVFKFLIWIIFLALPLVKKFRESRWAVVALLVLAALEIYVGVGRPHLTSSENISLSVGLPNGPPVPAGPPPFGTNAMPAGPPPFGDLKTAPPPPKPYRAPVPAN